MKNQVRSVGGQGADGFEQHPVIAGLLETARGSGPEDLRQFLGFDASRKGKDFDPWVPGHRLTCGLDAPQAGEVDVH